MEKTELTAEEFTIMANDSVISYKIITEKRILLVFVQPFYGFVVWEAEKMLSGTREAIYNHFQTDSVDEWNQYYDNMVRAGHKYRTMMVNETINKVHPSRRALKQNKN